MMIATIESLIFQRANLKQKDRVPISIYVDEAQDFVGESIEQMLVQGRKYGVSLTLATQIVGQKMTTELTKIILGNTETKFIGKNGQDSLRVMSRESYAELDDLRRLDTGQFYTRIGNASGFILKVPSKRKDNDTCITDEEWTQRMKEQTMRYYRPRRKETPEDFYFKRKK